MAEKRWAHKVKVTLARSFTLLRSISQVGRIQLPPLDFDQDARADASGFTEASFSSVLGEAGLEPSFENK